ncbi:hypothetical protein C7212DRAFT_348464 [Tuber magnatum]|uniref:Uncharacterized protein n=1 Tax=Tuber magnatum TaxID=42249 RepID=A0A317SC82_9PEZI|nr:hypothetical protein C7212DRAFT_348464 [Tuber magnatum]
MLNSAYLWTNVLIKTHPGPFIGGAFTVTGALAGSLLLVLESRAGCREAAKDLSTKFKYLDQRIVHLDQKIVHLNRKIVHPDQTIVYLDQKTDTMEGTIQEVKKAVEDNNRITFTTAHHTMTLLSGNKKPIQLFLADIEKCMKSVRKV